MINVLSHLNNPSAVRAMCQRLGSANDSNGGAISQEIAKVYIRHRSARLIQKFSITIFGFLQHICFLMSHAQHVHSCMRHGYPLPY